HTSSSSLRLLHLRLHAALPISSPEAAAESDEFRATLVASLRRLRDDDRLILAYRLFFDLSEAEMAEALKCPKGTVKSRLSRALRSEEHTSELQSRVDLVCRLLL